MQKLNVCFKLLLGLLFLVPFASSASLICTVTETQGNYGSFKLPEVGDQIEIDTQLDELGPTQLEFARPNDKEGERAPYIHLGGKGIFLQKTNESSRSVEYRRELSTYSKREVILDDTGNPKVKYSYPLGTVVTVLNVDRNTDGTASAHLRQQDGRSINQIAMDCN